MALGEQAVWASRQLAAGTTFGITQHETTLTETMLLSLRRTLPDLRVDASTKLPERFSGADWEWWIQGRRSWFGYVVQAKKTFGPPGRKHYELGYRSGGVDLQADLLIKFGAAQALPALYALYNPAAATGWPYASGRCRQVADSRVPPGADGVTVLAASAASWLTKLVAPSERVLLSDVRQLAAPWSCLASCPTGCARRFAPRTRPATPRMLGFNERTRADDPAYVSARSVLALMRAPRIGQFFLDPDLLGPNRLSPDVVDPDDAPIDADILRVRNGVRPTPPSYVPLQPAMPGSSLEPTEHGDDVRGAVRRPPRHVRGRTVPLGQRQAGLIKHERRTAQARTKSPEVLERRRTVPG